VTDRFAARLPSAGRQRRLAVKPTLKASVVTFATFVFVLLLVPGAAAATPTAQHSGLRINWQQQSSTGLGKPDGMPAGAYAKGNYVVSTEADNIGGRIWVSSNGIDWTLAWSGNETPGDIVPGGPGFVGWASGILLSDNGHSWTHANAGVPAKLLNSDFPQLGSAGGVVVAFPDSGHGYWSSDGHTWTSISGGPQDPITLAGDGTNLWALTGGRDFDNGTTSPVLLWVTADGQHWTQSAQLPNSRRTSGLRAAFGPLGGVVIAGAKSWYSKDDVHWHVATNTPTLTQKGRVFVQAAIGDAAGFIVTAEQYPPGCVIDPAQERALTWTSVDGSVWRKMSATGWTGREIDQLFITGRTLFGIGIDWSSNDVPAGVVWTAPLPNVASDTAPPPPPPPAPGRQGC
jgi:hypothetical protein